MTTKLSRRAFVGAAAAGLVLPRLLQAQRVMARRPIPRTGEPLPVVGLGTSDEFEHLPADGGAGLKAVITTLADHGGSVIDTAPGYGEAESLLGRWVDELGLEQRMFLCSKVSTFDGREAGMRSLLGSLARLDKEPLDLLQVHSLRDVHTQLENLAELRAQGRVRYIGVTTYRAMGYDLVEELVREGQIDFIQTDYSVVQPLAEQRLIPAAADHGVAVMVNSAFGNGAYFSRLNGRELPPWAAEFDCESWAQFSLKYILGNPDVTSVLAATSNPEHMIDNARAGSGALPDAAMRRRMAAYMEEL